LTDAQTQYGLIPRETWNQPDWIDEKKATAAREDMVKNQVIYGGMLCCDCVDDAAHVRPHR
jgi:alpha 1,2-mannosyltransferase